MRNADVLLRSSVGSAIKKKKNMGIPNIPQYSEKLYKHFTHVSGQQKIHTHACYKHKFRYIIVYYTELQYNR